MGGPPAVETAPVPRGSIARELEVSGTVEPLRTVGVNAQSDTDLKAELFLELIRRDLL